MSDPTPEEWAQFREYCKRIDRMLKDYEKHQDHRWQQFKARFWAWWDRRSTWRRK